MSNHEPACPCDDCSSCDPLGTPSAPTSYERLVGRTVRVSYSGGYGGVDVAPVAEPQWPDVDYDFERPTPIPGLVEWLDYFDRINGLSAYSGLPAAMLSDGAPDLGAAWIEKVLARVDAENHDPGDEDRS